MKTTTMVALALLGCLAAAAAHAQGVPQGSYLQSCRDARVDRDTLVAVCRTRDGGRVRAELAGVSRCVGDIGNMDGRLRCNFAGGDRERVL